MKTLNLNAVLHLLDHENISGDRITGKFWDFSFLNESFGALKHMSVQQRSELCAL